MERKLLLIVDPQIDFISGSLPVPGSSEAMDSLAQYIRDHACDYIGKLVTCDWHPYNHCSFAEQGGGWPRHCVQHSVGAAIYQPLIDALNQTGGFKVLYKGNDAAKEEYSIFRNEISAAILRETVTIEAIDRIDICGIAGDVCVLNTLRDGIALYGSDKWNILTAYCPSIDGGKQLEDFIKTF